MSVHRIHPHIGSHSSLEDAHYWHFARTSGLPRGTFDKPPHRPILAVCAVILVGLLAGLLAGIVARWLF